VFVVDVETRLSKARAVYFGGCLQRFPWGSAAPLAQGYRDVIHVDRSRLPW